MRSSSILSNGLPIAILPILLVLALLGLILFLIISIWRRSKQNRQQRGFEVLPVDDGKGK
jgi:hypothetical protein